MWEQEPWVSVEDVANHLGNRQGHGLSVDRVQGPACAQDRSPLKFKLTEVDEWVRAGGAAAESQESSDRGES